MNSDQIIMLLVIFVFYLAYFSKMRMQHGRGIATTQMDKGSGKSRRTLLIERLLSAATFLIVPVEVISIIMDTHLFGTRACTIAGIVIAGVGVTVFVIAMITMRDSWRAGIPDKDSTELITNGIYRFSRNPAFLGFDLMYIGTLIAYFNPVHLAVCAFAVILMHLQIREEETYLAGVFGEPYEAYRRQVARYFFII